jgi:biopolymer transport protein ExbB/TolQ
MLNEMSFLSSFSLVVIVTFVVIAFITCIALSRYYKAYAVIKNFHKELSGDPQYSPFLQKITDDFRKYTARRSKEFSTESYVESYLSEYRLENGRDLITPIKWVQSAGNIVILIGVLGTFIGLVLSLSEINSEQMSESVLQLLNGIHTAFYTSIFGIFASIVIHFFVKQLQAEHLLIQVMFKLENHLNKEIDTSKDDKLLSVMGEVKDAVQGINQSLSGLDLFSEKFATATHHLERFNEDFGENASKLIDHFADVEKLADALNQNIQTLDGRFASMIDAFSLQESLVKSLESNLKAYGSELKELSTSQQSLQQKQVESIEQFLGTLKEQKTQTQAFASSFKAELKEVLENMSRFYDTTLSQQEKLIQSQERLEGKNTDLIQNVERSTASMKELVDQGAFKQLGETSLSLTSNIQKLDHRFQQFHQVFQRFDQKEAEYGEILSKQAGTMERLHLQLKDEHKQFANYLQHMISQNEMIEFSIKEAAQGFKSSEMNNQRMLEKLESITSDVNQRFTENDRLFQRHSDGLSRALQEFSERSAMNLESMMRNNEGTIYNHNEQLLRQLERQNDRMVDELNQKFEAVGRAMSSSNQNLEFLLREVENSGNRRRREQAGLIRE